MVIHLPSAPRRRALGRSTCQPASQNSVGGKQSLESGFEEMGPREERTWQEARSRPDSATLSPRPAARETPEGRRGLGVEVSPCLASGTPSPGMPWGLTPPHALQQGLR